MPPPLQRIAGGRCGERKENSEKGREQGRRRFSQENRRLPWCGQQDSNLHAFGSGTYIHRVYQFHHARIPLYNTDFPAFVNTLCGGKKTNAKVQKTNKNYE